MEDLKVRRGSDNTLFNSPSVKKVEALSSIMAKSKTNPVHGGTRHVFVEPASYGRRQISHGGIKHVSDANYSKHLTPELVKELENALPYATVADVHMIKKHRIQKAIFHKYENQIEHKRKGSKCDVLPREAKLSPIQRSLPRNHFARRNLSMAPVGSQIVSPKSGSYHADTLASSLYKSIKPKMAVIG